MNYAKVTALGAGSLVVGLVVACTFDATGQGSGTTVSSASSGEDSEATSDATSGTTASSSGDATGTTTDEPTTSIGTTSTTTTSDASTSTDPSGSTTDAGSAMLVIAGAPTIDFGDVDLGGPAETATISITNEGTASATDLVADLAGPFAYVGGSYPGTGGSCGVSLEASAMCTLEVELLPTTLGEQAAALTLEYEGPDGAGIADVELIGFGIGTTANLLVNPGGETSGNPPPGWTETNGSDWQTTSMQARSGTRSLYAGDVSGIAGDYTLEQAVDISQYADLIDAGQIDVTFQAYVRSFQADNDFYRIGMRALTGGGGPNGTLAGTDTTSVTFELEELAAAVPADTRSLVAVLVCAGTSGTNCDAYFDDVSLTLTYVP